MNKRDFNKLYKLVNSEQYTKALEIAQGILETDEKDNDAKKIVAMCLVNMEDFNGARNILEDIIKYLQEDAVCWYYLGCCYDNLDMNVEAKFAYNKVLELRPEYVDAYKSLSISLIKDGDAQGAVDCISKALQYGDDDYAIYYIMGTAYMAGRNFEKSVECLKKAIELSPENVQLYNNLGTSYLTMGDYDKALEVYHKAAEVNPQDSLVYFNIASILQIKEMHNEACIFFEKAHSLEPEEDSYIVGLAVSEVKAGKIAEAIEHYKYLATTYPQKSSYKFNLATCYQMVGHYDIAIAILKDLLMLSPKSTNVLQRLASIYVLIGRYSEAKEIYDKMIKLGTTSHETYYELAVLCAKTNDTDKSEQMLKKVCRLKPDFAPAHKDLGVIYLNKRLFDYAKDEFELAYKYAPDNFSVVLEYANYLHATCDFEKADKYYQEAVELKPDNPNGLAFSALNKTHINQLEQAMDQIDKAMRHAHATPFLFFIAGRIYYIAKDYETAKSYLINSFELEKNPDTQNLLGLCYFDLGDYNQAKTIFENLREKGPYNLNLLLNLVKCYDKLNEKDKALEYLDIITEGFPECEEAHEYIRKLS